MLQFVFGDVLPRVCGQLLASTVQPAIRVRLCLARLTLCLIRAWSRQASAPNLPASVGPRAKPGARRLPKLSLLKGFWSCYRADSSARGGGLRIDPRAWAVVRPVRIFQMWQYQLFCVRVDFLLVNS